MFGTGKHNGFPDLTFLEFAVAVEGVDEVGGAIHIVAEGGTDAYAHALSKGAAGHADARKTVLSGGVSLETGAELAESLKLLDGEESAARHGAIDDRGYVALGNEEHVLTGTFHGEFGGVVVEDVELHGGHPVSGAERAAWVAGFGSGGHT